MQLYPKFFHVPDDDYDEDEASCSAADERAKAHLTRIHTRAKTEIRKTEH